MKVYIDLLVLLNTLFNYVLFSSISYILKRNVSIVRMIVASIVGNISILLLEVSNVIVFFSGKICIAIIINLVCFGYKDIRYLCKNVIYFYLVSIILAGIIVLINEHCSINDFIVNFTPGFAQ